MTAILTATLPFDGCREQTVLDFAEGVALAGEIHVFIDAGGADVAVAEDCLDVAGVDIEVLLGGGVAVAEAMQCDSW
ncbi:hypothetical protein A5789_05750 [Nocardia sp. 852002-51101_SCH5132738]|nr:hypothetical protein A5789_05750 [Nocardia sp. 852002-51101_SCH5132738]OBB38574.1 hypothetical protein A5748_02655 [Nocardia sp. 852002-51244_SCH5132740]OBF82950.1 hypothetical protein A9X06_18470 [Mycobacterium sp. 852002-51759_SCH5129042]